uniref:Apple domain-containing protein n=1 Tax=Callorhinchus milii TaxID=7868 RepID=A0A4W3GX59_CALMI
TFCVTNPLLRSLSSRFQACERTCDEDPCCKGFGFLRDLQTPAGEVLCVTLNGLGVQSCSEEFRTWRVMDCTASLVDVGSYPFGWYQKPGMLTVRQRLMWCL